MEPTVAPAVEIELGGKARRLKYGFRAYKAMGLNPFDPESLRAYNDAVLDIDRATMMIYAGLLHECPKCGCDEWLPGRKCAKCGSGEIYIGTVEDWLDLPTFIRLTGAMRTVSDAVTTDPEPPSKDPNEPAA